MSDQEAEQEAARQVIEALGSRDDALGFVARLNEGVFESCGLDMRTFVLVRLAAMAAMGGSDTGFEAQQEIADAMDVDAREMLGTLVAIAPVIGTARFLNAMDRIVADN
jgi:alkylhydroperoxidase/carboxymuconolactone decarboxylase family protein YurZ